MSPAERLLKALHERCGHPDPYGEVPLLRDGAHVGQLAMHAASPDTAWIGSIRLYPEFCRQGIGTPIMREILDMADEAGCTIALEAFWRPGKPGGGWLPDFYRSLDFEAIGGPGEDGHVEMIRVPAPAAALCPA
ncbi:hypothetical protein OCH239_09330 [Roseivivax halodurans JCM 10272]|uniref:N-acetyltransferase domain-containing protein n=1 Tax=Roseivivax halodurans JCM 10272 TaxID=1449350 RepID=X7EEL2_9RHOB|nr:GNAT family N-acetyltransferase [Roseivivax halodurans]ETX13656.1 hypothetical protein OCH239_09330 [Roseivivax halodurans JCM 10272]